VVSWQEAAEVMAEAFAETFDPNLQIGEFTPEESLRIEQLRHDVYGDTSWLYKR
jgi:lipoate-protein ligase A